jgi:4-amino-4-deoxy-L-arabinose transferase-like glycosyltransferase
MQEQLQATLSAQTAESHAARWRTAFWVAWAVLLAARIGLAATLAPFGDEAWYWQESWHLALGYSDLPPATAWLIRCGEGLFGHGLLAMRAPFLLLGALLPLLIVDLGKRLFDAGAGWCAGLLALVLPLLDTLGIFALPDVVLTFAGALALNALERASRGERSRDWMVLGLALAIAWLTHYRAAMLLFTGFFYFTATRRGRALLRAPGFWLAVAISSAGLIPLLLFNARHAWVGLDFQLVERHPWAFHADALVQPLEQALVCTPLFYVLLLWALWQSLRRLRQGAPWDLLAICAAVPIIAYLVLGCFADDTRFRVHWPLPGYLPLLVALPILLREHPWTALARRFIAAAFVLLAIGNLAALTYLGMAAVPDGARALSTLKAFPEHWVGWREATQTTRDLLGQAPYADAVLVADNFMLAAELDFAFDGARPVYALDQPINSKHGRAPQLALWQRDEAALRALGSRRVLLVAEPTARREREREGWMRSLCLRVGELEPVAQLDLYDSRKRYRWYAGAVPVAAAPADAAAGCRGYP